MLDSFLELLCFRKNEVANVHLSIKIDYDIFSLASGKSQIRSPTGKFG